jgi:hypothetical protein
MPFPSKPRPGPHWVLLQARIAEPAARLDRLRDHGRMLVPDERLAVVLVGGPRLRVSRNAPLFVEAPGEALGLMLTAASILARDPYATLLVVTSDLDDDGEEETQERLLRNLVASSLHARGFPDELVVLGQHDGEARQGGEDLLALDVAPEDSDDDVPRRLRAARRLAGQLAPAGTLLAAGCFAVWGPTLWSLARRCLPEIADRCDELLLVLRAIDDRRLAAVEEERVLAGIGGAAGAHAGFLTTVLAKVPEAARVFLTRRCGVAV